MTSRSRLGLASGALSFLILLAYANSFESGFVLDNRDILLEDIRVHHVTLQNFWLILNHGYWWPNSAAGLYRPVTTLSWLFNYAIVGNTDRPAGYHLINLLLHICNALLVFALARRLVVDLRRAFLIAAVWAVHPVLTESVTNIVGRADLLAGMTTLGGLLIYLKSASMQGWRRLAALAGLTLITTVGVFSKESAVVVIGVIALYELTWWNRRRLYGFLLSCLAIFPAFLAMWWMRARVLSAEAPARFAFVDNPIAGAAFWIGKLTAVKVLAKYLQLLVWPAHLSADYSYAQIPLAHGSVTDWLAWMIVAAAAAAVAVTWRLNKVAFFAAGFAFITLLPASNLIIPVGTIMAERLLYMPALGLSICLTAAIFSIGTRFRLAPGAPVVLGVVIVAGFGTRTWMRNRDWRDDLTFWSSAVQTAPLSYKTHIAFGKKLLASDPSALAPALREEERGLAILASVPDQLNDATPFYQVGGFYVGIGDAMRRRSPDEDPVVTTESIPNYERGRTLLLRAAAIIQAHRRGDGEKPPRLQSKPDDAMRVDDIPEVYTDVMLSRAEERLGRTSEAIQRARQAQAAGPLRSQVYERLYDVFQGAGRKDEARAALIEGVLVTADGGLGRKLLADYADRPSESKCEISYADAAPAINFSCEAVRKQVCALSDEVVGIGLKAGGAPLADRLRSEMNSQYHCAEATAR